MDAVECIRTRRSIRKFTDEMVDEQKIRAVIENARFAPTWKNSQTVRYIAVTDKALKTRIAEEATYTFSKNKDNINGAPVLMVAVTKTGICGYEPDGSFTTVKGTHWQSFDAGIAVQTMCLAAHEQGLGTVILGIFNPDKTAELLGLAEDESVSALIPMGYPAEHPDVRKRKTVDEVLEIK